MKTKLIKKLTLVALMGTTIFAASDAMASRAGNYYRTQKAKTEAANESAYNAHVLADNLLARNTELQNEVTTLKSDLNTQATLHKSEKEQILREQKSKYNDLKEKKKKEIAKKKETIDNLKRDLSDIKVKHELKLTQLRNEKNTEIQGLQSEISAMKRKHAQDLAIVTLDKDTEIQRLNQNISTLEKKHAEEKTQLANEKETKINELQNIISKLEKKGDINEAIITECESELECQEEGARLAIDECVADNKKLENAKDRTIENLEKAIRNIEARESKELLNELLNEYFIIAKNLTKEGAVTAVNEEEFNTLYNTIEPISLLVEYKNELAKDIQNDAKLANIKLQIQNHYSQLLKNSDASELKIDGLAMTELITENVYKLRANNGTSSN